MAADDDIGFRFTAMASTCEVRIGATGRRGAARFAAQAIAEVRRIEAKYSRYRADSVVSRINASAGSGGEVGVDSETAQLLDFADGLWSASDGLFDITSGTLRKAWDFRSARMPAPGELDALLPRVGWSRVRWDGASIALPLAGMEVDFGGFGKEYAADRAATVLQQLGVRSGLVNLGGDIRIVGPRPDGSPWSLGIQDPRDATRLLARLPLAEGALATSGDYERFFERDGRRYCHILDPRTGWPVAHWRSVSVVAPACLAAGALSTIAMLRGADAPAALAAQRVAFVAVDSEGRVHEGQPGAGVSPRPERQKELA
jgi:thiamine biosynthesis lipoprotein